MKKIKKFLFENIPRVYIVKDGIYIRWRDWEYIIDTRGWRQL